MSGPAQETSASAVYRDAGVGGCIDVRVATGPDGTLHLVSPEPLGPYPATLGRLIDDGARLHPQRTFAARRGADGRWQRISYGELRERCRRVGQALLDRGLSAERPIVILSGNDLEHLTLAMAATWVGIPYAPVSPAYSLISKDFGKLAHIAAALTPGLVFSATAAPFAAAVAAVFGPGVDWVASEPDAPGATPFATLLETAPGPAVEAAAAAVSADTIAKFLFTSGSTRLPKAVTTTHRMLCANQQMLRQCLPFLADEPPVLVDWLPWNHVFGGSHNVGIALYNGGTLYIDDGKPTPAGIAQTLQNLREISPTIYFNVPKGFEEIARALPGDAALRERLFDRVRVFFFAGAGLSQAVWDALDRIAEQTVGARIPMITGLGMTETAPSSTFAVRPGIKAGHIGLPAPGVECRLVPVADKLEIRFRGPHVMPGYWRDAEQTAAAFDDEGYYRTGDAVRWVDEADPRAGLRFDGRIAEDFKLSSGTFVSVGPMRMRAIAAGAPCVQDAVVAGLNRDDIGLLLFVQTDECVKLAGAPLAGAALFDAPPVRAFFQALADRLWREGTGSATRVARLLLLAEAPSIDKGEITDKGSINQRAVLAHRSGLVDALYADPARLPGAFLPATGVRA